MFRFLIRPRWILLTLIIAVAAVAMVRLGQWQFDRHRLRQDSNAAITARLTSEPVDLPAEWIGGAADIEQVEWRSVRLTGRFGLETETFAAPGSLQLVSLFETTNALRVLVNRGAVPVTADIPPIPQADMEIIGRMRRVPSGLNGRGSTTYVELISAEPSDAAGVAPLAPPNLSTGSHLSYAVQWYAFAGCVIVGWLLLVRRSAKSRRTGLAGLRPSQRAIPWRD